MSKTMKKVRITVLETQLNETLAKQYGVPNLCACPKLKVGQVFVTGGHKPAGFCEEAWCMMTRYVFAMCHGVDCFWEDWINEKNTAIISCIDGLRPVIFKLEAFIDGE